MPLDAALPKVAATRQLRRRGRSSTAQRPRRGARSRPRSEVARTGRVLIHPYDHPDIVTGQGTIGLEIVEQVPDVRTVVVPTGGGGLLAGVAAAVHAVDPTHRRRRGAGRGGGHLPGVARARATRCCAADVHTMADGIAVPLPGEVPFGIIAEHVDDVRTVTEEELSRAVLYLVERAKLVVEPSGAAGVAALLSRPGGLAGTRRRHPLRRQRRPAGAAAHHPPRHDGRRPLPADAGDRARTRRAASRRCCASCAASGGERRQRRARPHRGGAGRRRGRDLRGAGDQGARALRGACSTACAGAATRSCGPDLRHDGATHDGGPAPCGRARRRVCEERCVAQPWKGLTSPISTLICDPFGAS